VRLTNKVFYDIITSSEKFTAENTMNTTQITLYDSPAYKRSRRAYTLECAFEYFVSLLVTDAFLASLLSSIGLNDSLIGVITSFISVAFLFQLFSVFIVRKITNTKRFAVFFHALSQLFFMSLYLIPFLPFEYKYKEILVIVCILFAYFGNYLVTSMIYKWGNSFVDPKRRGVFSAGKEMISLILGMAVTLIIGFAMDSFTESGNTNGGFIFAASAILVFSICDFICLMLIKKETVSGESKKESVPMRTVLKNTLGSSSFRSVILLTCLWDVARYTTVGFLGTYSIGELGFTVGAVQIINIIGNIGRFTIAKPLGAYSDKHSYASGIKLAIIIAALGFAINVFSTPKSAFLFILYSVLYNVSMAGTNQNLFNITYSYVDSKYFVEASAIKNSIGGICGFAASALASRLLAYVQENGNILFGIRIYGQQVLSLISFILLTVTAIFIHTVIEKQERMLQ